MTSFRVAGKIFARGLLTESWRGKAPKKVLADFDLDLDVDG
jgi:hypothetical protein